MPLACEKVCPGDQRPPVERETHLMPRWLSKNLKLIHEEVRKYNLHLSNTEHVNPEEDTASKDESSCPSYSFPPGTRYPPSLPDSLARTLKQHHFPVPKSSRKKKSRLHSRTTNQSKTPPSIKDLEKALCRLPPLLPKFANQNVDPDQNVSKSQKMKGRTKSTQSAGKTRNSKNSSKRNQEKLAVILPTTPVTFSGETQISVPLAGAVGEGNVIMALTTALLCPTQSATLVVETTSSFNSLVKEYMNQRCGTLLKLSTGQSPSLNPLSVSSQYFLLPPGCVVTNSLNVNPDHSRKSSAAQESDLDRPLENFAESTTVSQASVAEGNTVQENNITETTVHEEELEYGDGDFRERFLTLSESSGSPAASLSGDDDGMETVDDVEEHRQRASPTSMTAQQNEQPCWTEEENGEREDARMQEESRSPANITSSASVTEELTLPENQEMMEKRLEETPATGEDIQESVLFLRDSSDEDPLRDVKDIAFAQAYLEKVCEALQALPGKVGEFLSILYEFQSNPNGRNAVDLFMRLQPVLSKCPELLRDFAAFLHPEQAQECGLLEEHQAFERSRRFLRKLERSFGEHSMQYRRVVRTLQQGLPKSHRGSEELKAQIAMLFRDHTHLLEEYWVFYEQLHPTMPQHMSDDDEENELETDGMPSAHTVHSAGESQRLEKAAYEKSHSHVQSTHVPESRSTGTEITDEQNRDKHHKASQSPVCAKNSSRTPSGEKVVLWTREADRVILTTCQQRRACQRTFTSIAAQLGNKTATEVCARYQHLIKLFRKSTNHHHGSHTDTEGQFHPSEEKPA
ncbi:GON-4-like protein [Tachysurus ichikawai]